ncbi:hypothetical protein Salat_1405900 [Sesamum alatum]|uniref:Reverse transcriptase zinc-binding domain-containing protein n=1 Tax=Sesamum alatum TaxID=300844 RepID=A0AAE1YB29_9LAMI|nr:hypothetical protein Salat_1405900 [Sesamum alatum]
MGDPSSLPMKIGFWNVRGFHRPLKHNGVAHLIRNNQLCLLGILETKLSASAVPCILNRLFPGWCHTDNFHTIVGGRMLIIWNPVVIDVQPDDISPQVVHCRITNKSSQLSFYISFTYGLYTVINRRSMWEKLMELGQAMNMPWLILDNDSNPVWCKLDRVLLNNEWLEASLQCNAHFSPLGCLSDHLPGIITLFDPPAPKPKPFRFFNMWAEHPDFLAAVEAGWNMRGKEADLALQEAQLQLESNPGDATLQDTLRSLRKKAVFLAEAERHFFYQKAKIHFLKMGDRNTKFFHDMVKRNATRNSISAITRPDGSVVTTADNIAHEFVAFYTSLLGTDVQTSPVDDERCFNLGMASKKGDSPLLQRLAEIRNKLITDFGSPQAAIQHMDGWSDCRGLVTSKAYEFFRPKLTRQPWKATIWKAFIPPKYSFIMWLGLRGRLATRDRLAFLQEDPTCSLCINTNEMAKLLFFECPFSACVWTDIRQWLGINRRMSTILSAVK